MAKPTQKRLVRKIDLERFLSQVVEHPSPQVSLEQYTTSETVASTMLYVAAYANDDIIRRTVLDLGCGAGRLALGAAFLGAQFVVGVDIDRAAIAYASENSKRVNLARIVQWINGDVDSVRGKFDTVLQNPPFGVQKRGADRKFLEKALEVGSIVYSLHNHPRSDKQLVNRLRASGSNLLQVAPAPFIERFVENHNGSVKSVYAMLMSIPHMFAFHTKEKYAFIVDLYVLKGTN
jgi:putative methylase